MFIGTNDIQRLFPGCECVIKERRERHCLTGWLTLEDAVTPYTTHLLYVCRSVESLKGLELVRDMSVICLEIDKTTREELSSLFPDGVNIIFPQEDLASVRRILTEFFSEQHAVSMLSDSLLDILYSEGGIQAMVNQIFPAFGNPIFVFDTGFNLIAANWDEAKRDDIGARLVENKGFSKEDFDIANRMRVHKRMLQSETPILSHNKELGYDQLLCSIDTAKDVGHIVISAVNRPFSPIDARLLTMLKKSINEQLKKNEFLRNTKGTNYEHMLRDILDGRAATGKAFIDRLNNTGSVFSGAMHCLAIDASRSSGMMNAYHIRNLFESRFPDTKTLMYTGMIIVILGIPEKQFLSQAKLDELAQICVENELFAGLSNRFTSIVSLPEYYKQALRAIELGTCLSERSGLFRYDEYYLRHMMNIFAQKESSDIFCHPKMRILLDYDTKNSSELAYSLYMYLTHERNIVSASDVMHIHRNTLNYRIKKITSLIGECFEDYKERQYLILSYEMSSAKN